MSKDKQTETKKSLSENDKDELAFAAAQHDLWKHELGGHILMRGISEHLSSEGNAEILDSGTGGGIWMQDVATRFPNAKFVGTDIKPSLFPTTATANSDRITYAVHDILDPWPAEYQNRFDLVHQRIVLSAIQNRGELAEVIVNLAMTVKPGGWIQLQEADPSPDVLPKNNGPAMNMFAAMVVVFSPKGDPTWCSQLKTILQKLGFEDVQEELKMGWTGVACRDKGIGMRHAKLSRGATEMVAGAFKGKGMFDDDKLETFPDDYDKEMESQGGGIPCRFVWGRKRAT